MKSPLSTAQQELVEKAHDLADREIAPNAAEVDRTESYPWNNVAKLRDAGFMGMTIPKQYGGPGLTFLDATLLIEEMARVCGVTVRISVEANMGAVSAVMKYGTQGQKKLAADLVLGGDKPAICITEPEAGSAATTMTTRADKRGDKYILNGRKHWITGGGVSKLFLIFARVFNEAGEEQGIAGFIAVHGETPGLVIGDREPTMGLRGIPETVVTFEDMEISEDMMLSPPGGLRRGFGELMEAYNSQRVGAATVALGLARGAFETALEFSKNRDATLAAQAKVFTSEMAIKVTNDALQIHGAAGYSRNNPIERMTRDARMFTIGGGTAQVLRTLIASRILERKLPQTRDGYIEQ